MVIQFYTILPITQSAHWVWDYGSIVLYEHRYWIIIGPAPFRPDED
jgi:hypothetical protein